ncbi:uncharacterized protein LOC143468141 isoform X1 [Clavelina lepadiformis]|uniref:uncharacterized protein LOC143468141 isoform X1 n=1 Tax=Clavelina lepadiformis TaxID=159417 RepID=UPI0040417D68
MSLKDKMRGFIVLIILLVVSEVLPVRNEQHRADGGGFKHRRRQPGNHDKTNNRGLQQNNQTIRNMRRDNTVECGNGTFVCDNGNCIDAIDVCNFRNDCGDRSDENKTICRGRSDVCWPWQSTCTSNGTCIRRYFQCNNGKCIQDGLACNRRDHCGDNSDEEQAIPGLKCVYGSKTDVCVLPQRYLRYDAVHCLNEADRCFDNNGNLMCFECLDKRLIIANTQVCDGVFDCYDLSDECLCEDKKIPNVCENVCLGPEDNCTKGTFQCGKFLEYTARITDVCNRRVECPDGVDERYCRQNASTQITVCPGSPENDTFLTAYVCDGRPECYDLSDECDAGCAVEPAYCIIRDRFLPDSFSVRCDNGFQLTQVDICDGRWSQCEPRIMEEEEDCVGRFECSSRNGSFISIDSALHCNGYSDCDDDSDEEGCDRFYCTTVNRGPRSVPKNFVLDDFRDCTDGSDECPPDLDNRQFSSRNEMISNVVLRGWLWIMAIAAIVGNSYVIIKTVRKYKKLKTSSTIGKANHTLIFNLALADGLMGVYLIILAGHSAYFSGRYCYQDERWRTGNVCSGLGALSVIASESSVYILAVMTALRLYTVSQPLKSRELKLRYVYLGALLAWSAAITLAVVPLSTGLYDVIIDGAWFPSKFFQSTAVDYETLLRYSTDFGIYTPNITTLTLHRNERVPWLEIKRYLNRNSPNRGIRGFFGYYSLNSVCISKLFVTPQQRGWQFSMSIVFVNFILFLFVACAYATIYKLSNRNKVVQVSDRRQARMQRKIIRLVVTDFACWISICLMSFVHFSQIISLANDAYVVTAVVLLPINSVLNPLLYSNAFGNLWKKLAPLRSKMAGTCCPKWAEKESNNENEIKMSKPTNPVMGSQETVLESDTEKENDTTKPAQVEVTQL